MDKNNKYYDIIENLVKSHKKYAGMEAILDDIMDDVYSHSEIIISSIKDENVIKSYLEKIVSTSLITVPKKLNYNKNIHHTVIGKVSEEKNNQISSVSDTSDTVLPPESIGDEKHELRANTEYVDKMINLAESDKNQDDVFEPAEELNDDSSVDSTVSKEETNNIEPLDIETIDIVDEFDEIQVSNVNSIEEIENEPLFDLEINDNSEENPQNEYVEDIEEESLFDYKNETDEKEDNTLEEYDAENSIQEEVIAESETEKIEQLQDNIYEPIEDNSYEFEEFQQENVTEINEVDSSSDLPSEDENVYAMDSVTELLEDDELLESSETNTLNIEDDTEDMNSLEEISEDRVELNNSDNNVFLNSDENGTLNEEEFLVLDGSNENIELEQNNQEQFFLDENNHESEDLAEIAEYSGSSETEESEFESNIIDTDNISSKGNDFVPSDFSCLYYEPKDILKNVDSDKIISQIYNINDNFPELKILSVYNLKYKQNMPIAKIAQELSIDESSVVMALNKIIDLV